MKSTALILFIILPYLFTRCEQEVFNGPPDEPPPQNGKILIQSNPKGSKIYFDSKNMGIFTPDSLSWLNFGQHTITLRKNLFKDTTFTVFTSENSISRIFIDYYSNPGHYGKIDCYSEPPDADIYVNGINTNKKTPSILPNYFPGYYTIKTSKKEHRADSLVLPVNGGITNYAFFVLEDTSKYVTYKKNNSKIASDYFYQIITDGQNKKWLMADSGIISFTGKNWNYYNSRNSLLPNSGLNRIAIDKQNRLWAATSSGLFRFNGYSWEDFTSNLPSSIVFSVITDKNGIIWTATSEGLVRYDGFSWKIFNTKNSAIFGNMITSLAVANDGKIWFGSNKIGTYDGVDWFTWDLQNMQIDPSIGLIISDIEIDKENNIWVAHGSFPKIGIRGGLTKFDGLKWSEIKLKGISTSDILSIDIDADNFKWISTKYGIGKFNNTVDIKIFYRLSSFIPVENVRGISIDRNMDLWFATFGDGIVKIKNGNY